MVHRRDGKFKSLYDFGRRSRVVAAAGSIIIGPMFFAMATPLPYVRIVEFTLPDDYVENCNLGMRCNKQNINIACDALPFGDQCRWQVDVCYVAARQRAIELAVVIEEDCMELGIDRSPMGVASWCDDRRPPLYWVGNDVPKEQGPF